MGGRLNSYIRRETRIAFKEEKACLGLHCRFAGTNGETWLPNEQNGEDQKLDSKPDNNIN